MNNQNNKSSNNQTDETNPTPEAIIFMGSHENGDMDGTFTEVKEALIKYLQKESWNIVEFIKSNGFDDRDALNQLISLVQARESTNAPLTIFVDEKVINLYKCPIFYSIIHILNIIKPLEIKSFYHCFFKSYDKSREDYLLSTFSLNHYLVILPFLITVESRELSCQS